MVAAVTTVKFDGHLGSHISSFGSHISSFVGENLCCVRNPGGTWGMVTDMRGPGWYLDHDESVELTEICNYQYMYA